jgi:hypothetical protein
MPVVGFLQCTVDAMLDRLRAIRQGLKDTGYVEGENGNHTVSRQSGQSTAGAGGRFACRQVAVIIATGVGVFVAKAATVTILSFLPPNPVGSVLLPVSQAGRQSDRCQSFQY